MVLLLPLLIRMMILQCVYLTKPGQPFIDVPPMRLGRNATLCCSSKLICGTQPNLTFTIETRNNTGPFTSALSTMPSDVNAVCYNVVVVPGLHRRETVCTATYDCPSSEPMVFTKNTSLYVFNLTAPKISGPDKVRSGQRANWTCSVDEVTIESSDDFAMTWHVDGTMDMTAHNSSRKLGYVDTGASGWFLQRQSYTSRLSRTIQDNQSQEGIWTLVCAVWHRGLISMLGVPHPGSVVAASSKGGLPAARDSRSGLEYWWVGESTLEDSLEVKVDPLLVAASNQSPVVVAIPSNDTVQLPNDTLQFTSQSTINETTNLVVTTDLAGQGSQTNWNSSVNTMFKQSSVGVTTEHEWDSGVNTTLNQSGIRTTTRVIQITNTDSENMFDSTSSKAGNTYSTMEIIIIAAVVSVALILLMLSIRRHAAKKAKKREIENEVKKQEQIKQMQQHTEMLQQLENIMADANAAPSLLSFHLGANWSDDSFESSSQQKKSDSLSVSSVASSIASRVSSFIGISGSNTANNAVVDET